VRPAAPQSDPPIPGVIDTISAGFQLVNRAPGLLLIPVLLDLLLWLGPKLSIAGLAERALSRAIPAVEQLGQGAGPGATEQLGQLERQVALLKEAAQAFNLLVLLAFRGWTINTAVPAEQSGAAGVIEITRVSILAGLAVVLGLVGVALACVWLGALAQQVRDGRLDLGALLAAAPRYWLAILGFLALAIVAAVALMVPLTMAAVFMQVVAPGSGAGVGAQLLFWLAVLVAAIFLTFLFDAIVVSEVGPVRAALNSIRVVSSNFSSSLGLIIITWVIMSGMGLIWGSLARAPAGQAVAILGNGYIESGLAAASMLFYRNRITRLTSSRGEAGGGLRRD
jgi:hypothetical protein